MFDEEPISSYYSIGLPHEHIFMVSVVRVAYHALVKTPIAREMRRCQAGSAQSKIVGCSNTGHVKYGRALVMTWRFVKAMQAHRVVLELLPREIMRICDKSHAVTFYLS